MSQNPSEKEIIHKEFELERLILFSDAVFAIAITLLIIDIKFPEIPANTSNINYLQLFKPTILQFLALVISFFFIGVFWAKHLTLFKYLKGYNKGVIIRNLFFLFFIVVFPFAAAGMASHVNPHFALPIFIYIINVACCSLMHTLLCYYIFYVTPNLTVSGHDAAKKYIYLKTKYATVMLFSFVAVAVIIGVVFPDNPLYLGISFYVLPLGSFFLNRKLKKHKPKELANR